MIPTPQLLEQRIASIEAELVRINALLSSQSSQLIPSANTPIPKPLPFGVFANDPYFDEILQRLRQERELDDDNPAYT
ncbi:MAG: hypothetical protein MUF49_12875 [Oculatellaceae cyanobacterium Prado106]|nr:hypothetical protein [Oculatellaceae cyanobacterium Prado106]